MNSRTKAWVKGEIQLGRRGATLPILLGAVQSLIGIGQALCAARLLAAVLHLAGRDFGALWAAVGFIILAIVRAAAQMQAERLGFEAGATARRRLRNEVLSTLLALGPGGLRGRHSAELAATAIDRVEAMEGLHARWITTTALAVTGPLLIGLAALCADWRSGIVLLLAGLLTPFAMAVAGIGASVAAKRQFLAMTRLQVRFLDRIRGISTIVLAGRAADEAHALASFPPLRSTWPPPPRSSSSCCALPPFSTARWGWPRRRCSCCCWCRNFLPRCVASPPSMPIG
jgi:ATP-binding cassette, subfamily C, bacterial CydD